MAQLSHEEAMAQLRAMSPVYVSDDTLRKMVSSGIRVPEVDLLADWMLRLYPIAERGFARSADKSLRYALGTFLAMLMFEGWRPPEETVGDERPPEETVGDER